MIFGTANVGGTIGVYSLEQADLFAAQTAWYIDPDDGDDGDTGALGHPLRTAAEWLRRYRDRPVAPATTLHLLGSLPKADPLRPPYLGPTSYLEVIGPMTQTDSGTLTAGGTALNAGSNQRSKPKDSAQTWASMIGQRMRWTGGARDGALALLAKDTGSNTVEITEPLTDTDTLLPTLESFATSDAYVVEEWSVSIGALEFVNPISNDFASSVPRLVFKDLEIDSTNFPAVMMPGLFPSLIVFDGCLMWGAHGTFTANACSFDSLEVLNGETMALQGCLVTTYAQVDPGGCLTLDAGSTAQACSITALGGSSLIFGIASSFDFPTDGVASEEMAIVRTLGSGSAFGDRLFGSSANAGYGYRGRSDSHLVYRGNKPTIAGATNHWILGATANTWANAPAANATTGASIRAYA